LIFDNICGAMLLRRSRFAVVLAVLAIAFQAVWPAVAQSRPADSPLLGAICSVDGGAGSIDRSGDPLPADGGPGKHQKHCALCVAGGERAQAPAPAPVVVQIARAPADAPAVRPAADFRSSPGTPAQPRAPPRIS
jgi:hypothetical protein